jgi:site-specific DNA-methyltransferase (adenine-specific)
MKIESVAVEALSFDPRNARKHDEKNLSAIAGSLDLFGQRKPIVVTGAGVVVAGNGTLQAAKSLGWEKIDVVRVPDDWSDDQVKAFALADNRTAELAVWDEQVMASQLLELDAAGFDIAEFGFEAVDMPVDPDSLEEDEVPELPVKPKSKLGQLYRLGRHRLMCGDSTDLSTVEKLMDGTTADLVFTDPPYQIQTDGGFKGDIGKSLKTQAKSIEFIADFDPSKFLQILPSLFNKKTFNSYIFCNKELLPDYLNWAKNNKISFNVLIWKKPNAIPIGDSHRPDIEYLILFRKNAIWNNGLKNVNYSRCLEYGRETGLHPTMKPIELIANEILISSNDNSVVVDLFGGSGSTLIACEQTNRIAYLMECSPQYVDVIIQRWENLTGGKAELVS